MTLQTLFILFPLIMEVLWWTGLESTERKFKSLEIETVSFVLPDIH